MNNIKYRNIESKDIKTLEMKADQEYIISFLNLFLSFEVVKIK